MAFDAIEDDARRPEAFLLESRRAPIPNGGFRKRLGPRIL
jgi:hypothetical protein